MPFVTPGPAVSAHTPVWRVAFAHPSAANVADCSWRVSTMSIPSSRQPSKIEKMWPPESVNSLVTPCAFRRLATSLPPWSPVAWSVCCSVAMRATYPSSRANGGR